MGLRRNWTEGEGLEMRDGQEGKEGGGSRMTLGFQLPQLSSRVRWEH